MLMQELLIENTLFLLCINVEGKPVLGIFPVCHIHTYNSVSKPFNIYEVGLKIIQLLWDSEMSVIHMLLYSGINTYLSLN